MSSLISNLLRSVADLLQGGSAKEPEEEDSIKVLTVNPEDLLAKVMKAPNREELETGVIPKPAVNRVVPLSVIGTVEAGLGAPLDPEDLTFWFKDLKFQLLAGTDEAVQPPLERPKASNHISSAMQYMMNLIGVNSEVNEDVEDLSFRFTHEGKVYKIAYIHTGSHVRPAGSQNLNL